MIKKFFALIFTLALIAGGVYIFVRYSSPNVASPDNMIVENPSVIEPDTIQSIPDEELSSITITKDPGNETVIANGVTWFVAHADNAESLRWILIQPNNAEYSTKQISEVFPELKITILSDDTVELKNIPLAMNGWRIKAEFGNDDGKKQTAAAVISVVEYDLLYSEIVEKYKDFCSGSNTYIEEVSPLALVDRNLGYMLMDINGDGTQELIIGAVSENGSVYSGGIFDIYTIKRDSKKGDKPVRIVAGSEELRFYLRNDMRFYSISSQSFGVSDYTIYSLDKLELKIIESAWTDLSAEQPDGYFLTRGGARDSEEFTSVEKISESDFYSRVSDYDAAVIRLYPSTPFN